MPTDPPTPPPNRYLHAPRLPEGDAVDVRTLAKGEWTELEIGPGRGGFMLERAAAEPTVAIVGFEVKRKWATLVDERLKKNGFGERARVFAEDALAALPRLVPDASVRRAYLHFPDPWWKKRHTKRLVMGDAFLESIARLLEKDGELFVQTDVEERAEQYEKTIEASGLFVARGDVDGSPRVEENPFRARTHREHRAIKDGLPIHRMLFRKR